MCSNEGLDFSDGLLVCRFWFSRALRLRWEWIVSSLAAGVKGLDIVGWGVGVAGFGEGVSDGINGRE